MHSLRIASACAMTSSINSSVEESLVEEEERLLLGL
jgi:hypothetical protein